MFGALRGGSRRAGTAQARRACCYRISANARAILDLLKLLRVEFNRSSQMDPRSMAFRLLIEEMITAVFTKSPSEPENLLGMLKSCEAKYDMSRKQNSRAKWLDCIPKRLRATGHGNIELEPDIVGWGIYILKVRRNSTICIYCYSLYCTLDFSTLVNGTTPGILDLFSLSFSSLL